MSDQTDQEGHYWWLLESTQQQQHPGFVKHLSSQQVGEEGRACVIEFQDGSKPSVQEFKRSRTLRSYLDQTLPNDVVRRRAFVLEGLPRNFIQVLGPRLKVPPGFFASHWAGPGIIMGNLLNRTPRHYDSDDRFILTFPKLHQAQVKALEDDSQYPIYNMESDIHRPLSCMTLFGDFDGPLSSFEQLSFWGVDNKESWDCIVLVDPPLGKFVKWRDSLIPREVHRGSSIKLFSSVVEGVDQRGSWYPSYNVAPSLGPEPTDWRNAEQSAGMESMYNDILLLYPLTERSSTAMKKSCTDICRRMVLSAWTARLRIAEAQIIQAQCQMSIGQITAGISAINVLEKSWMQSWQPREFSRLVRAKSVLESITWELDRNMDALGICSASVTLEPWEVEAWRSLQGAVQNLKARLDIILQAYMQAVSIRESIASNKQARQVGYLTSLATLFIPISFIAAIFSMGGNFSAGGSYFWVYWAIAIPVLAMGCLFLFTKLGSWIIGNVSKEESLV